MIIYTENPKVYRFFPEIGREQFFGVFYKFDNEEYEGPDFYEEVIYPIKDVIKRRNKTNMSGIILSQEEKGIKENVGKVNYSEINLNVLDLMAERFTANKHKYPKGNMLKPLEKDELLWAAFRHIKKMLKTPSGGDKETYTEHLAAVMCNMSMVLDQLEIDGK